MVDFSIKHCVDCRHMSPGQKFCHSPLRPLHPNAAVEQMVYGGEYELQEIILQEARTDPKFCGEEARWFEAKRTLPLWRQIFRAAGWS